MRSDEVQALIRDALRGRVHVGVINLQYLAGPEYPTGIEIEVSGPAGTSVDVLRRHLPNLLCEQADKVTFVDVVTGRQHVVKNRFGSIGAFDKSEETKPVEFDPGRARAAMMAAEQEFGSPGPSQDD